MSEQPQVRVRFAPSPTGYLHIGGARTALFNWLFARKHGGAFILRIEDTDQSRYVANSEQDILGSLRWLGLAWDEGPDVGGPYGPYRQSERADLYRQWAGWLIEHGHAYRCNCSAERLAEVRKAQEASKQKPGYDRHCRERNLGPQTPNCVIRIKMPLDGETTVLDLIRGEITFQNAELQDQVLMKSDGLPTYHLANVVDDHLMRISHIMRADEWIASAPLHQHMYHAFSWQMPQIAHLPVILSPSGKGKLSKRDQAFNEDGVSVLVQVREFRRAGYLPEALTNFLCNVGWAFGDDREVFPVEEAVPRFELAQVNPAGGKLPYEKLEWLNGIYIRELPVDELAERLQPYLEADGLTVDVGKLRAAAPHVQERIKTLAEATDMIGFLFRDDVQPASADLLIQKGMNAPSTKAALLAVHSVITALPAFEHDPLEEALRVLAEQLGLKPGQLFGALRGAVTGQSVSPPLFETMLIIGRDACLARIQAAADTLGCS